MDKIRNLRKGCVKKSPIENQSGEILLSMISVPY